MPGWGTILFGEEAGDTGAMYELIDPLSVEGATIDRTAGTSSSPKIRRVNALGFNSFEGLAIMPNGVTYYGNELSANSGAPGGAYYKFVPTTPWAGGGPISSLDQSPYASGSVYALRVGTSGNNGQGFQYGRGSWQPITGNGVALRPQAVAVKATGTTGPRTSTSTRRRSLPATSASTATTPAGTPRATSARRSASPMAPSPVPRAAARSPR